MNISVLFKAIDPNFFFILWYSHFHATGTSIYPILKHNVKLWHKVHLSGILPCLWRMFLTPGMRYQNPKTFVIQSPIYLESFIEILVLKYASTSKEFINVTTWYIVILNGHIPYSWRVFLTSDMDLLRSGEKK